MANTATQKKTAPKKSKKMQERVLVIIPKPHNVTGDSETIVALNGEVYQIEYDKPVKVPKNVAEIIESSRALQAKILKETEAAILTPKKTAIADL